ncbi:MAG: ribonuclease HI [Candidatus Thorarchaeota archaeon]
MSRVFHISFDGACEPVNPGGVASWGYTVIESGVEIASAGGIVGEGSDMTNNVAEYSGLISALEAVAPLVGEGDRVVIRGDSQLVIRQIRGEYAVKSKRIGPLHSRLKQLIGELSRRGIEIEIRWIPREENMRANDLARRAYADYVSHKTGVGQSKSVV